jgi:Flp pilus assembly protein TadG
MKRNESGQALLEFALCFPLILAASGASVALFRSQWNQVRCSREAFLAAHRALRTENSAWSTAQALLRQTAIERTETGVLARARCGNVIEVVRLPDLERAQW